MKKTKYTLWAVMLFLFASCNLNFDRWKPVEATDDSIEIIDTANNKHLLFKGVPIDGTLKQYIARMKKAGFTHVDTEDGVAILQGDFAGRKDCIIYVATLDGNDIVSNIVVKFPEQASWEYLYGDYKNLKELLTEKYGTPSSVTEEFQGYKSSYETDNNKLHKVKMDECKYETRFVTDKGEIILWIEHDNLLSTFVCLKYKDKLNISAVKQQAINDL
ncbi:MAG: hypothetical protein IKR71_02295 [Bacteroidales bacterium]|nr:hypothetical protein [Bacteroidales bacterium]